MTSTVGVAWRPPIADLIARLAARDTDPLRFTEVVAENVDAGAVPTALLDLAARGVEVVPHGVGLGLAGASRPDADRLAHLAGLATRLGSPLVSEHVAFVRAPGRSPMLEAGHLVPSPRTRDGLDVLCDNVIEAQAQLPVPLALENVAATLRWPEDEFEEPDFLTELVTRTGCLLLLDVANLYATHRVHGGDAAAQLLRMPLERVAYVHIAGGAVVDGTYLDTHAHDVPEPVLDLLALLLDAAPGSPSVLLERDVDVRPDAVEAELARIVQRIPRTPP